MLARVMVCGLVAIAASLEGQSSRQIALVGGTLIDGTGGPVIRNSVILIVGDRITAVGTTGSRAVPAGYQVISTEGMSVLPGLWDMHVHTMINGHGNYAHWDSTYVIPRSGVLQNVIMPASAKQLLMAGITLILGLIFLGGAGRAAQARSGMISLGVAMLAFGIVIFVEPDALGGALGVNQTSGLVFALVGLLAAVLGIASPTLMSRRSEEHVVEEDGVIHVT